MKRPLIHKGFYREMVRQLRTKGLVAIFILLALNLIAFASFASQDSIGRTLSHTGAGTMACPMLLFLYIAIPVMTFGAYRWLNKRVQSDFYHAIPLTRTQIYVSTSAAILVWIGIALGSFAVTRAILYAVFSLPFNYLLYLCVFLNMLLAAITILGAFSIACALSGKRFVAFFSAFTILFLPRFLMDAFWMLVEIDTMHLVPLSRLPFFLNPAFNIAGTPLHSLIYGIDYANVVAMVYSLLYGAGLMVLGCIAFNRRKSEAAIIPYTSKVLQTATRIACGLPWLALLTILLNVELRSGDAFFNGFMPMYVLAPLAVMSLVFSFIFYCLYELISSKSMKSVVKSMVFYPICIAIALIMLFVPVWIGKMRKADTVSAEAVTSYRFHHNESSLLVPMSLTNVIYGITGEGNTYADVLRAKQTFQSEDGAKAIADGVTGKDDMPDELLTVRDGGLFGRTVGIESSAFRRLQKLCLDDEAYRAAFYAYPKGAVYYACAGLTPTEAREVGRLFRQDYEALNEEQRGLLMASRDQYLDVPDGYTVTNLEITLYGCWGTANYTETFTINELTPNAARQYLTYVNARYGEQNRKILREYVAWMESPNQSLSSGNLMLGSRSVNEWDLSADGASYRIPKNVNPEMYEILKALSDAPLTTDISQCVTVGGYTYSYTGLNYNIDITLSGFAADGALQKALTDWMRKGESLYTR